MPEMFDEVDEEEEITFSNKMSENSQLQATVDRQKKRKGNA